MHVEILSEQQQALLPWVKQFRCEFYLVGGTVIALYLGHHNSIDFDLFSEKMFRAQLCYFEDIDYSEEVDWLIPNPPTIPEIMSCLTRMATQLNGLE